MSNPTHVARLKEGLASWNAWREGNPRVHIDLRGADLQDLVIEGDDRMGADLIQADLSGANLQRARLRGAVLIGARLEGADLRRANLTDARLVRADLTGADLSLASLSDADLRDADLTGADLTCANLFQGILWNANLSHAHLRSTVLMNANLTGSKLGATTLADLDLSVANGLSSITHLLPSDIGCATLWRSRGRLPKSFLRGAGVPESLMERLPELAPSRQARTYPWGRAPAFAFHYISHDGADKVFAERLQARLRADGFSAWLVPESMKTTGTGEISMDRVQELSRLHDKLLIVMSEASLESEWLSREIHLAHRREIYELRRILFPIRIAPDEAMARTDDTLRQNLSSYLIHDFSGWRYELSEPSIQALLKDLRSGFRPECEELSAFEDS